MYINNGCLLLIKFIFFFIKIVFKDKKSVIEIVGN